MLRVLLQCLLLMFLKFPNLVNRGLMELLHGMSRAAFLFAAVHWRLMETSTAAAKKIYAEVKFFDNFLEWARDRGGRPSGLGAARQNPAPSTPKRSAIGRI